MMRRLVLVFAMVVACAAVAQDAAFHNAPASYKTLKNPADPKSQIDAGRSAYGEHCASCHGAKGEGQGNVPRLSEGPAQNASEGELYWFITHGEPSNGMPSFENDLADTQRWQIVSFLRSGTLAQGAPVPTTANNNRLDLPAPTAPFTDFRFELPGAKHKITAADLPAPYQTKSATNGAHRVPRPQGAWPKAPPGFKVNLFAEKLDNPRLLRTAPNGDVFVAESAAGRIRVLHGLDAQGKPQQIEIFAQGLKQPFGIAFYPPGADPQWIYIGATDAVLRIPYRNGDLRARGTPEKIASLPGGAGHWTRDVCFSRDGKQMFVSVGSASNINDPDTTPAERDRATILVYKPDGSGRRVFASGVRNAVGLDVDAQSGELWASVNERDGLGDNLPPDYITHIEDGGFYGWPWWYTGAHQDPRLAGKHPELRDKSIVPDVLLQPHNASLQLTIYAGVQFPGEYHGDIFAAEHGSWNRALRTGYEVIRVPRHHTPRASGEYEDFLTGFVLDNGDVWGRPVGVTVAKDGSLLVSDDAGDVVWRVSYAANPSKTP